MTKYVSVSDINLPNWSLFSSILLSVINSRFQFTLNGMRHAAKLDLKKEYKIMMIASTLIHLRGMTNLEELNPVRAITLDILYNIDILSIIDNHNLNSCNINEQSSAIQNTNDWAIKGNNDKIRSFRLMNKTLKIDCRGTKRGFVSWYYEKDGVLDGVNYQKDRLDDRTMEVSIHNDINSTPPIITGDEKSSLKIGDLSAALINYGVCSLSIETSKTVSSLYDKPPSKKCSN